MFKKCCVVGTGILVFASVAWAQPKASRRPLVPPGQVQRTQTPAVNQPAPVDPNVERMCTSRRTIMSQEQQQLDSYRAELAGIDAEIASMEKRMKELRVRREDVARMVSASDTRFRRYDDAYKKECQRNESCTQYEVMANDLTRQSKPVQDELTIVRNDMSATNRTVGDLKARIEPLQREYAEKKCDNLIPGETTQVTIDRCSAIFSDWNRLQADLNRQNSVSVSLRNRFEQLINELKAIEARANTYQTYMVKNCTAAPQTQAQVQVLNDYGNTRRNAENLGRELDNLINEVARLRGLRITVTASTR